MSGSTGLGPVQAYLTYSASEVKYANANAAASGQATSLVAYFTKAAPNLTSPSALLNDYKALSVVLGAFNLGSQINSTALLKQLLTQDPTSKSSLAYRSANAQFLSFATALHSWSPPPFATSTGVASIVTAYKTNLFEASANGQTPGLQQALYFTRIAGSITTLTQLQSDQSLLAVAVTGVGLPLSDFESLGFDQQTTLLTKKLNISDLQKPSYVKHLAELFLVQQQLSSGGSIPVAQPGTVASLFDGSTPSGGDLLTILTANDTSSSTTSSLLGSSSASTDPLLSLFA